MPFLLCLLLCGVNACGQDEASAKIFLENLYKGYQSSAVPDYLGKSADTLFTPDLLNLIRKDEKQANGEVGLLDSDPICDCQDFQITDIHIRVKEAGGPKPQAEASFANFGKPVTVGFILSKDKDGKRWRIADIRSRSMPSLYRFLSDHLK